MPNAPANIIGGWKREGGKRKRTSEIKVRRKKETHPSGERGERQNQHLHTAPKPENTWGKAKRVRTLKSSVGGKRSWGGLGLPGLRTGKSNM